MLPPGIFSVITERCPMLKQQQCVILLIISFIQLNIIDYSIVTGSIRYDMRPGNMQDISRKLTEIISDNHRNCWEAKEFQ